MQWTHPWSALRTLSVVVWSCVQLMMTVLRGNSAVQMDVVMCAKLECLLSMQWTHPWFALLFLRTLEVFVWSCVQQMMAVLRGNSAVQMDVVMCAKLECLLDFSVSKVTDDSFVNNLIMRKYFRLYRTARRRLSQTVCRLLHCLSICTCMQVIKFISVHPTVE